MANNKKLTTPVATEQQRRTRQGLKFEDRILNLMIQGVVVTDINNKIIFVNHAITRMTGYDEQELLNKDLGILYGPLTDQKGLHAIQIAHNNQTLYQGEILFYRKDGSAFWNEIAITPEQGTSKKPSIFISTVTDISSKKDLIEQVSHLAFFDGLTNLPNRNLFNDRLTQAMHSSKRFEIYAAIMFVDLDKFKRCNDDYGHTAGDLLLVEAANRMSKCVRQTDTVSRFGGDEFLIILSNLTSDKDSSEKGARLVGEKILSALFKPYKLNLKCPGLPDKKIEVHCTASIGIVTFIDDQFLQNELVGMADKEMYKAKNKGGNQISCTSLDLYKKPTDF